MTETRKTVTTAATALVLAALAWTSSFDRVDPRSLADRGQPFFPDFTDPNAATSLEVVEFEEQTSTARPFKVLNLDGRWTIPSHDGYPADGGTRLASIAATVIGLKKDEVASDNLSDHERCGVLDPLDETLPATRGRGTRITVRGRNDRVLAEIIAGKAVEGRPNFRFVRLPDRKRTYVARVENLTVSTRFEDWIERNLLQVERQEIDQIVIRNYATDAETGRVDERGTLVLRNKGEDVWAADDMATGETMNTFSMNLLVTRLLDLAILDVRRKPPGITATLGKAEGRGSVTPSDVRDLASKGFYFTSGGRLLSNQGEVLVHTSAGIFYVLRFGSLAPSRGGLAERYLFISAGFDPTGAGDRDDEVKKRLEVFRARFAPWYYIVSDDDFRKIRLSRQELVKR